MKTTLHIYHRNVPSYWYYTYINTWRKAEWLVQKSYIMKAIKVNINVTIPSSVDTLLGGSGFCNLVDGTSCGCFPGILLWLSVGHGFTWFCTSNSPLLSNALSSLISMQVHLSRSYFINFFRSERYNEYLWIVYIFTYICIIFWYVYKHNYPSCTLLKHLIVCCKNTNSWTQNVTIKEYNKNSNCKINLKMK